MALRRDTGADGTLTHRPERLPIAAPAPEPTRGGRETPSLLGDRVPALHASRSTPRHRIRCGLRPVRLRGRARGTPRALLVGDRDQPGHVVGRGVAARRPERPILLLVVVSRSPPLMR